MFILRKLNCLGGLPYKVLFCCVGKGLLKIEDRALIQNLEVSRIQKGDDLLKDI